MRRGRKSRLEAAGGIVELGGADRLTMAALLDRCRVAAGRRPHTTISIPLAPIRLVLGLMEPLARPILPMTAGQLAAFVNHSIARPSAFVARLLPHPRGVDDMLKDHGSHG